MLIAHQDKVSVLSTKDNFTKRHTFKISDTYNKQMSMSQIKTQNSEGQQD
jgi:hypothetical protein